MEVSPASGMPLSIGSASNGSTVDAADDMDMQMDMDIDLGPLDVSDASQPYIEHHVARTINRSSNVENATPHKLHLRGLDDLTTDHIKAFTAEHFPSDAPARIEWIDDTSANVVFSTPAISLRALENLTHPTVHGPLSEVQLRAAKEFSGNPDSKLEVRLALVTDQKRPRAHEASRFYMMHPELDPREQRRRERNKQERPNDYRRRRYGQEEHRRRRRDDRVQGFEPTMYDDDISALVGRSKSVSMHSNNSSEAARSFEGDRPRNERRGGGSKIAARDRSASPRNESVDRENGFSQKSVRRRSPLDRALQARPRPSRELFPLKVALVSTLNGGSKELFPNKRLAANLKKELFPSKAKISHHRRSDAFDAADETADLFAKQLGLSPSNFITDHTDIADSSYGRLNSAPGADSGMIDTPLNGGLSIRGAAQKQADGIKIRGITADGTRVGTIRELFPERVGGNAGKELFAEKLQGRGGKRNKAEDMFY